VDTWKQAEHSWINAYNQQAQHANQTLQQIKQETSKLKGQYPAQLIVGSTVAVALVSFAASFLLFYYSTEETSYHD